MSVSFKVEGLDELQQYLQSLGGDITRTMERVITGSGYVIEGNVKAEMESHRITGHTIRAIRFRRIGKLAGEIGSTSLVSIFLERGTKPRVIFPTSRRVLRFVKGGVTFFRGRVSHPGTPPYRPFEIGLQRSQGQIDGLISAAMRGTP